MNIQTNPAKVMTRKKLIDKVQKVQEFVDLINSDTAFVDGEDELYLFQSQYTAGYAAALRDMGKQ